MKVQAIRLLLALAVSFCTSGVYANKKSVDSFGVIDMQKVLLTVEEGKVESSRLEKEFREKEVEFKAKKEELDKLTEEYNSQASMLSDEAKMRKQKQIQEMMISFQKDQELVRMDLKRKEFDITQKLALKVAKITQEISKTKNLSLVYEKNNSGIIYAKEAYDLTDEVIEKYNKESLTNLNGAISKK
ncbi:MAG: hypothetical protein CMP11_04915 [Zetaproteobacteria bacterium]|nr:hypothetical protein [Pseudobdellovibrionaceae bacterium]|tara:strand:+ start:352 stop:912 length:561 start_codon:yes stop_codon:yes gene_type:complete